jgi:SprT-like protein
MNQIELQKYVEEVSLKYFKQPFLHQATWNSRLRTTGGRYHTGSHHLDFNKKVWETFGEETFLGIVKHELCHYHLHLAGRGHRHRDSDFKELLKQVGGLRYTPSLKAEKEVIQLWQYQCKKCGTIANRQRRFNTKRYVCAKCKGRFELIGREEVNLKAAID